MADKKPFDNAASMRKMLLAGTVLVGAIVAGTTGIRSFFRGEPTPSKAPEALVAVEGGVELGAMDKKTNTLTVPTGTHVQVMAPGHIMLSNAAGKTSKDMFFEGHLNLKTTGPAGVVNITAYPDVEKGIGSTVVAVSKTDKNHHIVCDATRVSLGKMAAILNKGEGPVTFVAPQPMDATGFQTSRNPKGTFITNRDNNGFLLIAGDYKGAVALQTAKGTVQVSGLPHNLLQDKLKELATPVAAAVVPPAAALPKLPAGEVRVPDPKLPPAEKIVPPVVKAKEPTPEEKLAMSKADVRAQQSKVIGDAINLRDETLGARQIGRNIIANNPRINNQVRSIALGNYDAVTANIQGNYNVWIEGMRLNMKIDDIGDARKKLGESLDTLKKVEGEFRGRRAEVDRDQKEKARQDAKEKANPLSSTGSGNNYAVTVRSLVKTAPFPFPQRLFPSFVKMVKMVPSK